MNIGVITTFRAKNENILNIKRICDFFDIMILIDNNAIDESVNNKYCAIKNLVIISNFNIGGLSGAFNVAKRALRQLEVCSSATLTFLDQDTEISHEVVNALITEITRAPRKTVIGAVFAHRNVVEQDAKKRVVKCLPTATSTMWLADFLLSNDHDTNFPVDFADFIWCWRNASTNSFRYLQLKHIHVKQSLGIDRVVMLGREISLPSPFRHEHQMRAVRRLWTLNYVSMNTKISFSLKAAIKLLLYPVMLGYGRERFRYMLRGLLFK